MSTVASTSWAVEPQDAHTVNQTFDEIILNHVYDHQAKKVLTQILFCRHGHVQAWRLIEGAPINPEDNPNRRQRPVKPEYDYRTKTWRLIWAENAYLNASLYDIKAFAFSERWTQYDIERADRDEHPPEFRTGLLNEWRPDP